MDKTIRKLFGAGTGLQGGVSESTRFLGNKGGTELGFMLTPDRVIAKYRELHPSMAKGATDRDLWALASQTANYFNGLGVGAYRKENGEPTEAWWNSVAWLMHPDWPTGWAPQDLPKLEEMAARAGEGLEFDEAAREYWELIRAHPEDPLYIWSQSMSGFLEDFVNPYGEGGGWDPARYEEDLKARITEFGQRHGRGAQSKLDVWGFVKVLAQAGDRVARQAFMRYANQYFVPGEGFSKAPAEILAEWIAGGRM